MASVVAIGAQWGDEGKGKIVDNWAANADMVVRVQGGNNAGHTVKVGERSVILHLIPSGILHPGVRCVIGNGLVVDPTVLSKEIEELQGSGDTADASNLFISHLAHVILPYHKAIDVAREKRRGGAAIGTTGRGIGPAYEDKVRREGIRMGDLVEPDIFKEKLESLIEEKNAYLKNVLKTDTVDKKSILDEYAALGKLIKPMVTHVMPLIHAEIRRGGNVLFEGAQGTMLDIDHGTYPFVTSSNSSVGGVCTGAGVAPSDIDCVVGICKAYTTRVGSGPFPTELNDETGKRLRESGAEFGSTTGRPRRCGWLDAVVLNYSTMVNGLSALAITKLDVLTGLDPLKICVSYKHRRAAFHDNFDFRPEVLETSTPVYEELPGWTENLRGAHKMDDLPENARRYLARIEEIAGVPIIAVSVGPGRDEAVMVKNPFGFGKSTKMPGRIWY